MHRTGDLTPPRNEVALKKQIFGYGRVTAVSNPESNCVANARQLYTSARPIDDGGSYKNRSSRGCRTLLRKLQSVQNATAGLITGTRHSDHISPVLGLRELHLLPIQERVKFKLQSGMSWFVSRCPGRRLSTWPTTAVSCPTAFGTLCGQLTFRLAWCREHSAVMSTELLQPRDLTCGTPFQSSCLILTSPTDCNDHS